MYLSKFPVSKKIELATTAITNALNNATIAASMDVFGYDNETLNQGKTLLDNVKVLEAKQQQESSEQRAATAARDTLRAEINETYMKHVKLARVAFKRDTNTLVALDLVGIRESSYDGWKAQVTTFYNAIDSNQYIKDGLQRFKISNENIEAVRTNLTKIEDLEAKQKIEIGEAQQATLDRDNALEALDDWMSDFQEVAKIALEDDPQLLEALGIVVKR